MRKHFCHLINPAVSSVAVNLTTRILLKLSQKLSIDKSLFCDKNLFKLCFMLLDTSSSNNKTKTTLNDVLM